VNPGLRHPHLVVYRLAETRSRSPSSIVQAASFMNFDQCR
jgi:hypothetical protein